MREGLHTALAKTRLKNHYGARYIGTEDGCPWYEVPCEQFEELFLDHAMSIGTTDEGDHPGVRGRLRQVHRRHPHRARCTPKGLTRYDLPTPTTNTLGIWRNIWT